MNIQFISGAAFGFLAFFIIFMVAGWAYNEGKKGNQK